MVWRWRSGILVLCLFGVAALNACSRGQSRYHVVRRGETLTWIGAAYGVSYKELAALNDLRDPDRIEVGQSLLVPQGATYEEPKKHTSPRRAKAIKDRGQKGRVKAGGLKGGGVAKGRQIFTWPVKGVLTSGFGPRNGSFHDGIDIAAPVGTLVRAAGTGRVMFSDVLRGYGKVVILKHSKGFTTVYAHHRRNLVKAGQRVLQGDIVGEVGQTGRVTGPNLHFEVRMGKSARDPMRYLPRIRQAKKVAR